MEQLSNNTSGSASHGIPIPTTTSRGFEPSLSLNYSSDGGQSAFGMGWALSLPEISRQSSSGIPKYNDSDIFHLSSEKSLRPKLDSAGQAVVTTKTVGSISYSVMPYLPCAESAFDIIERYSNNNDLSDVFWTVTSSQNIVSVFGKSDAAKIVDPEDKSRIFKWLLEERFDAMGNHEVYLYKKENDDNIPESLSEINRDRQTNSYLTQVNYGNSQAITNGSIVTGESTITASDVHWHFSIVFDYGCYDINPSNPTPCDITKGNTWACRQDPFSNYSAGFEIRSYRLCRNIMLFHYFAEISHSGPVLNTVLQLSHSESPIMTLMNSVQHIDYQYDKKGQYKTHSLPPLDFDYTPFAHAQPDYVAHNYERFNDIDKQLLSRAVPSNDPHIANHDEEIFADMVGSGQAQRVQISNAMVECWPCLGNGKFGKVVKMDNAPDFGEDFDSSRLLLVDIDGSGMSDLVYISAKSIDIYLNQSGNSFRKTPVRIQLPPTWDKLNQIYFADVRGNGTNCLVTSQPHPDTQQWFYDFNLTRSENHTGNQETHSQKPYLLNQINNNSGAWTLISYAASTKFHLQDKALPYSVNVIEYVSHHNDTSQTRMLHSYSYHCA